MKILKDKKIILLIIILIVFTIGYFIIVNRVSYAFSDSYNLDKAYNNTIQTIKKCAITYGEQNLDLFEKDKIIYVKVQDLIDKNIIATNESGNIENPLSETETLNSNVIKIKYEEGKITAEVDS